jgi:hypothetical protein
MKMGVKEIESVMFGLDLTGSRYRPAVSSRKQVNEILGSNFVTSQRLFFLKVTEQAGVTVTI